MTEFTPAHAGTWLIDPVHSRFGFSVTHAMVSKVRGHFGDFEGSLTIDEDGVDSAHVDVAIAVTSVHTGHDARDEHLRTNDFFEAERFPTITFTSTAVEQIDDTSLLVMGDLTIKGATKSLSIPLANTGFGRDHQGYLRAGFEGARRIDRRDFGLDFQVPLDAGGVLVSERITLEFELSLVRLEDGLEWPPPYG